MRDIYGCQQVVSRPALIWTQLISNTCAVWDCGSQVQNTGFVGRDINVLHHKSNKTGQFKKGIGKGVFRRKRREISCIFIQILLIYDEYLRSEHYWPSPLNKKSPLLRVCAIGLSCPLDLNPLSLLLLLSFLLWAWPPALVWTWLCYASWPLSLGVSYLHALQITPSISARNGAIPCLWAGCLFLIYYFSKLYRVS